MSQSYSTPGSEYDKIRRSKCPLCGNSKSKARFFKPNQSEWTKLCKSFDLNFQHLAKVCEYHWDSVPEGLDQLARDPKHRQKLSY